MVNGVLGLHEKQTHLEFAHQIVDFDFEYQILSVLLQSVIHLYYLNIETFGPLLLHSIVYLISGLIDIYDLVK